MNVVENGIRLRQLRGERPARKVAEDVGISLSALLMYERGERNPRDKVKVSLAHYYGVSVENIFFAENIT